MNLSQNVIKNSITSLGLPSELGYTDIRGLYFVFTVFSFKYFFHFLRGAGIYLHSLVLLINHVYSLKNTLYVLRHFSCFSSDKIQMSLPYMDSSRLLWINTSCRTTSCYKYLIRKWINQQCWEWNIYILQSSSSLCLGLLRGGNNLLSKFRIKVCKVKV